MTDVQNELENVPPQERRRQRALAAIIVAVVLALVLAVGGLASALVAGFNALDAIGRLVHLVAPQQPANEIAVGGLDPARDQYGLGFSQGDPAYNHPGPPGLACASERIRTAPRSAFPSGDRKTAVVSTCLGLDEQALIRLRVLDPAGMALPLAQEADDGSTSVSRDSILYRVLVPRVLELRLRFPLELLHRDTTYRLRIRATDLGGKSSIKIVPFRLADSRNT